MNIMFNDANQDFFRLGLQLCPKQIVIIKVPAMFHGLKYWYADETLSNEAFSVTQVIKNGDFNIFTIQAADVSGTAAFG